MNNSRASRSLRSDLRRLARVNEASYDQLVFDRPGSEGPRVFNDPRRKRFTFQVWDWDDDGQEYELHHVVMRQAGPGWRTDHFVTRYRALIRAEIVRDPRNLGLSDPRWREPEESGFHQPIVTARKPGS